MGLRSNKCELMVSTPSPQRNMDTTTNDIITDFIVTVLRRSGYNTDDLELNLNNDPPTAPMEILRILGDQFNEAYFNTFDTMVEPFDLESPEAREHFYNIAHVLFQNGIRWGRIVGLIVFASHLSVKAMRTNRPTIIGSIILWTCEILESAELSDWITQHGGWSGFVEFYRNPDQRDINDNEPDSFSWGTAWTVGVATIAGAAAIMNFFRS